MTAEQPPMPTAAPAESGQPAYKPATGTSESMVQVETRHEASEPKES
jgi:hypothetical protein